MFLLVLLLVVAYADVSKAPVYTDDVAYEFLQWHKLSKASAESNLHDTLPTYLLHSSEYEKRFDIFKQNLATIKKHNADYPDKVSWFMKLTPFADLTSSEFKEFNTNQGCVDFFNRTRKTNTTKPTEQASCQSVDWVARGAVTPVKNQGQCGSCWAFSTTGAIEGATKICGQTYPTVSSLSEQELVDCASSYGNNGCNGGLMDNAFKYVIAHKGLASETAYPYEGRKNFLCAANQHPNSYGSKITGYTDVYRSEGGLETALCQGPVSVAIEADQQAFQHYGGGVFSGQCGSQLDHGVLAVGFGISGNGYGSKYWKVKNSWGTRWGEAGYIRMVKGVGSNGGKGQCGILLSASYPKC